MLNTTVISTVLNDQKEEIMVNTADSRYIKTKLKFEGKLFKTQSDGTVEVIEYIDCKNIIVKFINTGTITRTEKYRLERGQIRDKNIPRLYGVGVIDLPTYQEGMELPIYKMWSRMMQRCYSEKFILKHPTYEDVVVADNWLRYSCFNDTVVKIPNFNKAMTEGWCLDKDILIKGNKLYSEHTCCFVPVCINNLFCKMQGLRGDLPVGVSKATGSTRFRAYVNVYGVRKHLGTYDTPEEAFLVYKQAKEDHIKEVANKWIDQIDIRVYEALMNYEVDIDD